MPAANENNARIGNPVGPAGGATPATKYVYKITYPNGKIYVGVDVTGRGGGTYFGTPTMKAEITADLGDQRLDFWVREQILWESDSATDEQAREKERQFILETRANDPAVGYNRSPKYRPLT